MHGSGQNFSPNLIGSVISLNILGLLMKLLSSLQTAIACNASLGCSAFYQGHWVQLQWPNHWKGSDILGEIAFLELVPIVLAFFIWGEELKNKILLRVDNQALISILNKRTSKSKRVIWKLAFLTMYNSLRPVISKVYIMKQQMLFLILRISASELQSPGADLLSAVIPQEVLMIISDLK